MNVELQQGAVHSSHYVSNTTGEGGARDQAVTDYYDDSEYQYSGSSYNQPHTYHGYFGLPYQDHNYGAPPPPSIPVCVPSQKTQIPLVVPQDPPTPEHSNGHIEVDVEGGPPVTPAPGVPSLAPEPAAIDDSITRCICDFIHDDGYMICCDKCSVWQHIDCMDIDRNNIPDSYFCEICEPRPLDKERARLIQLKKKEFLDTLTADSSATDTDPEMETNGQLSECPVNGEVETVKRKRKKSKGGTQKDESRPRKTRKDKKDVKKEKENKELFKKEKLQVSKKAGLSLMISDNTQDPWDSSYSPWVDKYEEAFENQYTPELEQLFQSTRINGVHADRKPVHGQLPTQLCHVTDVSKNRKGLEASQTIAEGEAVIEYTGKVMFKHQLNRDNFFKQLNPFVLFYNKINNFEVCIDATSYGNIARFIRRSCKANAQICHEVHNGKVKFYVYSTKVIPRGSEITIPYDYNYKDCTYCVECACLRNNCPVAKFFKKKLKAVIKKDNKATPKTKSPVKSPIKLTVKSPTKKAAAVEKVEEVCPEEDHKVEVESPVPVVHERATRSTRQESSNATLVENTSEMNSSGQVAPPVETEMEKEESNQGSNSSSVNMDKNHKMTREERKMEAIMKAFEKMEKREERRKEALHRIDLRKSVDTKPEEKQERSEKVKKEEKKEKPKEKEKQTKEKVQKSVKEVPKKEKEVVEDVKEPEPEVKEEPEVKKEVQTPVTEEKLETVPEVQSEPPAPVSVPASAPTPAPAPRPKARAKKAKRVSARRRTRASSGNAVSEPSLSLDDDSITPLPPPPASCPATPVVNPDTPNTPPSFKFLKTKKHLMNEWLNEKSQDNNSPSQTTSTNQNTDPLKVEVEEMFVTCLPSPRNAMEHLRRNSQSSGSNTNRTSGVVLENSIGSAKKRWLRQAMWEKPKAEETIVPTSTAPPPALGNSSPSLLSPGSSPPGDFVTPLKKRRMARESCDTPLVVGPFTASPTVTPVPCMDTVSQDESDTSGIESMSTSMEDKVTSPLTGQLNSDKVDSSKKGSFVSPMDCTFSSVQESVDGEISESSAYPSARSSVDLSSDSEQERTCRSDISHTGKVSHSDGLSSRNNVSQSRTLESGEEFCEVSNSVDNHKLGQSASIFESAMERDRKSFECDSRVVLNRDIGEVNRGDSSMSGTMETMEVDSTEGITVKQQNVHVDSAESITCDSQDVTVRRPSICDSTSVSEDSCLVSSMETIHEEQPQCSSDIKSSSTVRVDSSTDTHIAVERNVFDLGNRMIEETLHSSQDASLMSSIEQEAISASDIQVHQSYVDGRENVGSSSDGQSSSKFMNSVSSSSEYKNREPVFVESSQLQDIAGSVTSSGNCTVSENLNSASGSEMVDSSVCEGLGGRIESEEFTVEAEIVNISDSMYGSIDHDISALVPTSATFSSGGEGSGRLEDGISSSSSISEDMGMRSSLLHVGQDSCMEGTNLKVDQSSPTDRDISYAESGGSCTPSQAESEPIPPPTKKKVSLLEYRKRLKEKGSTSSTSCSSSSSTSSVSSSSSLSLSSPCTASSTSSLGSSHRLSLPSLPLFDASPPTKEPSHGRHQFKSSSDLIKRKTIERRREKPLSLAERLRKEFGFEDCEEESTKEAVPALGSTQPACSSLSTPPPPPPPPSSSISPRKNKAYEPLSDPPQTPPLQQGVFPQQTPPVAQGISSQGVFPQQIKPPGQVPQPIPSLVPPVAAASEILGIRGVKTPPIQVSTPSMVPAPIQGTNQGMVPPPGPLNLPSSTNPGPVPPPAPLASGGVVKSLVGQSIPSLLSNSANLSMGNGPAPNRPSLTNGPAVGQPSTPIGSMSNVSCIGSKIPSLLSMKTFPSSERSVTPQNIGGSHSSGEGPSPNIDQTHQFMGIPPQNQSAMQQQPPPIYPLGHSVLQGSSSNSPSHSVLQVGTSNTPSHSLIQTGANSQQHVNQGYAPPQQGSVPGGQGSYQNSPQIHYSNNSGGSKFLPSTQNNKYHPSQTNGVAVHEYHHGYSEDKHGYSDDKYSYIDKRSYSNDKRSYSEDKRSYSDDKRSYGEDKRSYSEDKRYSDDKRSYRGSSSHDSPSQSHYSPSNYHSQRKKSKSRYKKDSSHSSHRYSDSNSRYH